MLRFLFSLLAVTGVAAWSQPAINKGGVLNAASYTSGIAQGSLFVVFGVQLGPTVLVSAPSLPLKTSLPDANGTSIKVAAGGTSVDAFIYYTSAGQVAAILPSNTQLGPADLTVTFNGKTSQAEKIQVVKANPGVYTANKAGTGPASAQLFRSAADVSGLSLTNPGQPGQTIVVYATGLGPINGPDNTAPGPVAFDGVALFLNGVPLQPAYAGRSPQYPGLDQINFQLPAPLPGGDGCYSQAAISVNGIPGNAFTISTSASGGACKHPLGLDAAALARLDAGGTANIGLFVMIPGITVFGLSADLAAGAFATTDSNGLYAATSLSAFNQPGVAVAANSCVVFDQVTSSAGALPNLNIPGIGKELTAGDNISVSGPGGASLTMARQNGGGYLGFVLRPFFDSGAWTVSGSGGDIGPFSAKIDLPARISWTNAPDQRAQLPRGDTIVAWKGGGASDLVSVSGSSALLDSGIGKQFVCSFPASAGKGTIPASITSQLPAAPASGNYFGTLVLTNGGGTSFAAPGKIDAGALIFGSADTRIVVWK